MVKVYKAANSEVVSRAGYSVQYVADIVFCKPVENGGFIFVKIPAGTSTTPHLHEKLEEVFVMTTPVQMQINNDVLDLVEGDVVLVEPGESHSFKTLDNDDAIVIAIKFPNLKDDTVSIKI